ncbi:hypothetical protein GN956_G19584 [Arapaima gigas]
MAQCWLSNCRGFHISVQSQQFILLRQAEETAGVQLMGDAVQQSQPEGPHSNLYADTRNVDWRHEGASIQAHTQPKNVQVTPVFVDDGLWNGRL